jgi:TatD DNase family protein
VSSSLPPLVDTHCHLTLEEFDRDRWAVVERAAQSGVQSIVVPAIDLKSSQEVVALAEKHPQLYAAVGLHPHAAAEWSEAADRDLRRLAASPRVVAIGEIGLDYYRDRAPRDVQQAALTAQLQLAADLGLPVLLHSRNSVEDVLDAVQAWAPSLPDALRARCGVLHAFQGTSEDAGRAVSLGLYLGLGGPLTYPSAQRGLRSAISAVPAERLVLETDSPYLPPQGHRGERNEPAHLPRIAQGLAEARGIPARQAAHLTTDNATTLFGWTHGTDHRHLL